MQKDNTTSALPTPAARVRQRKRSNEVGYLNFIILSIVVIFSYWKMLTIWFELLVYKYV